MVHPQSENKIGGLIYGLSVVSAAPPRARELTFYWVGRVRCWSVDFMECLGSGGIMYSDDKRLEWSFRGNNKVHPAAKNPGYAHWKKKERGEEKGKDKGGFSPPTKGEIDAPGTGGIVLSQFRKLMCIYSSKLFVQHFCENFLSVWNMPALS